MRICGFHDFRAILTSFAVSFALFSAVAHQAVAADDPTDTDRAAVQSVIEDQMAAFMRNDEATAYGFAAPEIKRIFPDSATFMDMVRTQYSPVFRPRYVEFGRAVGSSDTIVQPVFVVGEDGQSVVALYTLERNDDSAWLITGCVLRPAPPDAEPL
jgi:hypothetical protein